jgi:antitoxin ParD1/3/4
MNVELTPELEQLIRSKVDSGRYSSASEVVGEALRLLDQRRVIRPQQRRNSPED